MDSGARPLMAVIVAVASCKLNVTGCTQLLHGVSVSSYFIHNDMFREGLFIISAQRTPFGTFGGKLKSFSATELGTCARRRWTNGCVCQCDDKFANIQLK